MRVGMGYDVHKLVEGRDLILGGVTVPHTLGLLGHSDADVHGCVARRGGIGRYRKTFSGYRPTVCRNFEHEIVRTCQKSDRKRRVCD